MSELERSPEFEGKLEEVRRMPQETEAESAEKREAAKLLRMEALLDNAQLTEKLEEDPNVTSENLTNLANHSGKIIHPEAVIRFIRYISQARDRAETAMKDAKREAGKSGQDVAHQLYTWLALPKFPGQNVKPEGELSVDSSYPLAIILYVRDKNDFNKIDSGINVAGFYRESADYTTTPENYQGKAWRVFPVAVVNSIDPSKKRALESPEIAQAEGVSMHEKGHAENKALIASVAQTKVVWGEYDIPPRLENPYYPPSQEALLEYALAHAKDELLAEMNAQGIVFFQHLPALMKKGGVYDYFANKLKVKPDSILYNRLWDDYQVIVRGAVQAARELTEAYQFPPFTLSEKMRSLRWVLAQIPIQKWESQLKATLFFQEARELQLVKDRMREIYDIGMANPESAEMKLFDKCEMRFLDNQERPLFPDMREFWVAVERLDSRSSRE